MGNILLFIFFSDVTPTVRHEDFRLFACMNPATDVGKKDLPPGIRNRFVNCHTDFANCVNTSLYNLESGVNIFQLFFFIIL